MSALAPRPVRFGRAAIGDGLEWLVTNGLGGFASGTVPGIRTRRYHGLLVAALAPPGQRTAASPPTPSSGPESLPHDEVARRAYEKYAARGFTHGQDGDDWLQAEKELEAERADEPRGPAAKKKRRRST